MSRPGSTGRIVTASFSITNGDGRRAMTTNILTNITPLWLSIEEQILKGMDFHRTRYRKATRYLAYFQSYSNTYDDLETLKSMYEQAKTFLLAKRRVSFAYPMPP